MKLIMESWRRYLNEVTSVPDEQKKGFEQAIVGSKFWSLPHDETEVDVASDGEFSTPAVEVLMDALNAKAEELGTDLYFLLTVTSEEAYTLGPDDERGHYPNNWLMRGQYRGPEKGKHIVWLEFRPISEDFNLSDLDSNERSATISRTINHELVHYSQVKKQATSKGVSEEEAWERRLCDPKQVPPSGPEEFKKRCGKDAPSDKDGRSAYLTSHIEIAAYAHEAAEQLYLQALEIRKIALQANHPDTAMTLWHLAVHYENQRIFTSAESFYLKALKIYNLLGCRHYARVDFRLSIDNNIYFLEVNTLPGFTDTSLFPMAAKEAGISYKDLLLKIISLSKNK